MGLKEYREKRKQQRKESRAFKGLMEKRTKAAQRRAYEKEALKVAGERGRELARRPSFGQRLKQRAAQAIAPRQPQRVPVRRRVVRRRTPTYRPVRRRRTYRRRPVRRTMRRASAQATQQAPRRSIIEDLI